MCFMIPCFTNLTQLKHQNQISNTTHEDFYFYRRKSYASAWPFFIGWLVGVTVTWTPNSAINDSVTSLQNSLPLSQMKHSPGTPYLHTMLLYKNLATLTPSQLHTDKSKKKKSYHILGWLTENFIWKTQARKLDLPSASWYFSINKCCKPVKRKLTLKPSWTTQMYRLPFSDSSNGPQQSTFNFHMSLGSVEVGRKG